MTRYLEELKLLPKFQENFPWKVFLQVSVGAAGLVLLLRKLDAFGKRKNILNKMKEKQEQRVCSFAKFEERYPQVTSKQEEIVSLKLEEAVKNPVLRR
jgi:hypothetical protein